MPNPILAVGGLSAGASLLGAKKSANAASDASDAQVQAAQLGIDEQRRQFDAVQELMAPFVSGGTDAFSQMASLAGVNGTQMQASAVQGLSNDPRMQYAIQSGEEALLANASATGGLRGGNTQAAMAQLRPQLLSSMMDQSFAQLGGLASLGQASAGNTAAAAQNFANNTTGLLQQQGSAIAGGSLAGAAAFNQGLGGVGQGLGYIASNMGTAPTGAGLFDSWGF